MFKGAIALGIACAMNMGIGQPTAYVPGSTLSTGELVTDVTENNDGTKCACLGADNLCYELAKEGSAPSYIEVDKSGVPVSQQ